ncbi:MAG: beta-eliminating lyase-related protein [Candidatus Baltobacteraceae bacterium]
MNRTFASDNNAPIAPEILQAILDANDGDEVGYGHDSVSPRAIERFRSIFGREVDVYFAFNGTGANVVALACLLQPWEAVVAPASAHLQTDECGAFERFAGSKVLAVQTPDGKLRIDDLKPFVGPGREEHHVQPRAISLSQATEFGGLYELEEIRELCDFAHAHGLYVHLDGARIANAAVALDSGLRECTRDLGVDVLTFGGTKNGLAYGEAVLFFASALHAGAAPFVRKQAMQLASKMRYIAAQFEALLTDDRWHRYAAHANAMTARLAERIRDLPGITVTRPVRVNALFATLARARIAPLQDRYYFYIFDEALPEVRWMTHFATRPEDVDAFAAALAEVASQRCVE